MKLKKILTDKFTAGENGFGINELLGIIAAVVIAAFIVIPGMRSFAQKLIDGLNDWWNDVIAGQIFPNS